MWDENEKPTLFFYDPYGCQVDILMEASDKELKELGLSSIIELRERIQKEITEWNDEINRLGKVYSLGEDMLADFFIDGHYEDS